MTEQLERIKTKINELARIDRYYILFGSLKHKYQLNPKLPIEKIKQFEQTHNVKLPAEYVQFVTEIGNGGVGPFYGLEPFENALFDDLDYKRSNSLLNPSKLFPHTEHWNLKFQCTVDEDENEEEYERQRSRFDETYFDKEQMNGVLAICNFGCAISMNLVVNGQEYGNIWTDDRANDNGIFPSIELGNKGSITFLNWYELWLDNSLKEIGAALNSSDNDLKKGESKKPWWKIWQ